MARVQIIANPASGGYSRRRIEALAAAFRRAGDTVSVGACGADPPAIDEEADHVCVAGGDGTLRHVAAAVARGRHGAAISAYPLGTINLLAREAGYPRGYRRFVARTTGGGAPRAHHAVELGDTLFLACASVGPEAEIVARVSRRLKRAIGRLAYPVALVGLLRRWPRARLRLEAEGRALDCEAFHIAKGRFFAGPWRLAREADGAAPEMRVVALVTARRRDVARFWAALLLGRDPAALPFVTAFACAELAARALDGSAPSVQADGDVIAALPARLRIGATPLRFA